MIPIQIWFQYLESNLQPQYMTQTVLDTQIPFVREFIIPYVLWFAYVPFGLIYLGLRSKRDFYKLFLALCGGMAIANIVFTVFPNAQGLRPVIHSDDPFSTLIKFIYAIDTPTNVCPSLHVIEVVAVNAALQNSAAFSERRYRKTISSIFTLLVCLSTVFIKQHSIVDVFCGLIVATAFYIPLYIVPRCKLRRNLKFSMKEPIPANENKGFNTWKGSNNRPFELIFLPTAVCSNFHT